MTPDYIPYVMLVNDAVAYTVLATGEHHARQRIAQILGKRWPAIVAAWEAEGRPVEVAAEWKKRRK